MPGKRHPVTLTAVFLLAALSPACIEQEPRPAGPLIDHELWQPLPLSEDPFSDHAPASIECPEAAWFLEDGALEVDTGLCNYLALQQPARIEVRPDDRVSLIAWHAQLWDINSSEAHIAVLFDDHVVWQEYIPIPADPGVFDVEFTAPEPLAQGQRIQLHLHNHGSNSWNLLQLSRLP
ncbi:MAG: hypothetical protein CMP23_15065 [Rickettsiales bacterium]|nr:hypothetical protein [Rickettsiales bacterium]|tara:strand:- start:2080 stop:2613 length:534 start_codon:yes stop_codon:yes gene_type:complete